MTRLTVRVKNCTYDIRNRYGYDVKPYNEYTGEVYPNPKWVGDNSFCLTTGDEAFPFRVISKEDIMCGWYWADSNETMDIAPRPARSSPTKVVEGSNGKKYVLTKSGNKWSCNCTGFSYRRTCSHIKEAANG